MGTKFTSWVKGEKVIIVYNSQGLKVEEIKIPAEKETITINVQGWTMGMYVAVVYSEGLPVGQCKFVVQ